MNFANNNLLTLLFIIILLIKLRVATNIEEDRVIINDENINNQNRINVALTFSKGRPL